MIIDNSLLKNILKEYKNNFNSGWWEKEKYKLEAVKCFQDNWNINADDFPSMLKKSLEKTYNLLGSGRAFHPDKAIINLAQHSSEEVRKMFINLYDETKDIYERIEAFKNTSLTLYKEYNPTKNDFQKENTISVYLWLRFPDKYYIYKFGEIDKVSEILKSEIKFKIGDYKNNISNCLKLYNEINKEIKKDQDLIDMYKTNINNDNSLYTDPNFINLTNDVCFFISRQYLEKDKQQAFSKDVLPIDEDFALPSYSKQDFLNEVFMDEKMYDNLVELLINKKNIILQGAPGVGKTFAAKRLAASLLKEKNDNYIEFVQFHQNYSYEDFVMGYRPVKDGFELKYGIFYQFCKKAIKEPNKNFYFIIDEINRGNISKIFGELLMLIENSYRDKPISLSYNGESFYVPSNLYIIGLMNTADRSLAMIDYALRRRFSFFEMEPAFDSEGFIKYQKNINNKKFDELISLVKELNEEIINDKTLGKGFCIGHSYFCDLKDCSSSSLSLIVRYDILPTLNEYWFDDTDKLMKWQNKFRGIFE